MMNNEQRILKRDAYSMTNSVLILLGTMKSVTPQLKVLL